jgi:glycosyltransferase involved in cell wall biosynthesis
VKLKVYHFAENLSAGVLDVVSNLANSQVAQGIDVEVFAVFTSRKFANHEILSRFDPRVQLQISKAKSRFWALPRLYLAGRNALTTNAGRPNLVFHSHSSYPGLALRLLNLVPRNRFHVSVFTPHCFGFMRKDLSSLARTAIEAVEAFLSRYCDAVVCVSQSEFDSASELINSKKIFVIPNGIDLSMLHGLQNQRKQSQSQVLSIVSVGRLEPQKNFPLFKEIASQISGNYRFIWIGANKDSKIGLGTKSLQLVGWQTKESVLSLVEQAHVYISTSSWEGAPISLLEALALGKPALVTDVAGNRDFVQHGVNGYLCSDLKSFISRIHELSSDSKKYAEMQQNAKMLSTGYDAQLMNQSYLDLYLELIGGKNSELLVEKSDGRESRFD